MDQGKETRSGKFMIKVKGHLSGLGNGTMIHEVNLKHSPDPFILLILVN